MRYAQLRAFHAVAAEGGFSAAAAALGLSQPAVSDQVRQLEHDYDIRLFDRSHRRVTLTTEGRRLFDIIAGMFDQESRARVFLTESQGTTTGTLRLIADSPYHVTGLLRRFRQRYPDVRIAVSTGNAARVVEDLVAYRADIGVLGETPRRRDLESVEMGTAPIIAFAARGFLGPRGGGAMTLGELARLPLVMREPDSKTRRNIERAARARAVALAPAIEAEGREAVREIVAAGLGVGFVSQAEFGDDSRLVPIAIRDAALKMKETIVCLRRRREARLIRAFMALARRQVEDEGSGRDKDGLGDTDPIRPPAAEPDRRA